MCCLRNPLDTGTCCTTKVEDDLDQKLVRDGFGDAEDCGEKKSAADKSGHPFGNNYCKVVVIAEK